ncbi:hypothetical protein [Bradyrhizobium sp. SZCCHNS3053]|uniref:hypothetical protein n=1 Tax=Bradyrhizobium sp. SZCCHNS3053 TaxID=3057322 RepID=UPI002915CABF|nr:hypothetical protein [Bradyrhizobium sp. SZCCHNS3053]
MTCPYCNGTKQVWRGGQGGDYEPCECTRTIKLEESRTWPARGSVWEHRNGNRYEVMFYTNVETTNQTRYPTTIVYRNTRNTNLYSRPLADWERSMTLKLTLLPDDLV